MSKSENKKSAPPKTPVAPKAAKATGQEARHTPGPWTACLPMLDGKRRLFPHVHFGPSFSSDGHCRNYVTINEAGVSNTGGLAPFDANARLIAAAPELLQALKRIERAFWKQFANPIDEIKSLARAAIAKAEGRAA